MSSDALSIVVAGDVVIDCFETTVPTKEVPSANLNWQRYPRTHIVYQGGGAVLLAEMVSAATGLTVHSYDRVRPSQSSPQKIVHAVFEMDSFPDAEHAAEEVYRISRFRGFRGPSSGTPSPLKLDTDTPDPDLIVLDDAGEGFRDDEDVWPEALQTGSTSQIILKMRGPLLQGKLWKQIHEHHGDRTLVVVSANDLRSHGLRISRRLSWERTAQDLCWELAQNPSVKSLGDCRHLLVRFGMEAAIHYRGGSSPACLYFDPKLAEDDFTKTSLGHKHGANSAFVAAVTAHVLSHGVDELGPAIRCGLQASREVFSRGFGSEPGTRLQLDGASFSDGATDSFKDVPVPCEATGLADPGFWCILKDGKDRTNPAQIVLEGESCLTNVPIGRFGDLKTVDRAEIEGYRSIDNLLTEYHRAERPKRPLSIAVFGPPGCGKSFGVTEIAKSIAPDEIKKIEFNLTQFDGPKDLIHAWHRVRDEVLGGSLPLVFFDEFDCDLDGLLGWLKYFLSPMQDGKFADEGTEHPVGKAILVFAGGTSKTYAAFSQSQEEDRFRAAKGPDFLSRLRGCVDVMGPNRRDDDDELYVVRRGMLLRSILERNANWLIDSEKKARVDPGVIHAMLNVESYKHGARSMEAILDMSMLSRVRSFEQAALPPATQLDLHVDGASFLKLLNDGKAGS